MAMKCQYVLIVSYFFSEFSDRYSTFKSTLQFYYLLVSNVNTVIFYTLYRLLIYAFMYIAICWFIWICWAQLYGWCRNKHKNLWVLKMVVSLYLIVWQYISYPCISCRWNFNWLFTETCAFGKRLQCCKYM